MDNFKQKQVDQNRMSTFLNNHVANNVKSLELRLSLLVCPRNLSFSLPQEILNIFKKELPNNPVLNLVSLGKTKTANIIRECMLSRRLTILSLFVFILFFVLYSKAIGQFLTTEMADRLRNTLFSAIIDESTGTIYY